MMQIENDPWNNAEFDAFYGRSYFAYRARFFERLVLLANLIGFAGFVSGLLLFDRQVPFWVSAGLLGLGVVSVLVVQQARLDLRAKQCSEIRKRFAEIESKLRYSVPSYDLLDPLLEQLITVKAAGADIDPVPRKVLGCIVMNDWLDLTNSPDDRVSLRWYESWFANIFDRQPADGWASRRA